MFARDAAKDDPGRASAAARRLRSGKHSRCRAPGGAAKLGRCDTDGPSSNGRTPDFGSGNEGSNPSGPTRSLQRKFLRRSNRRRRTARLHGQCACPGVARKAPVTEIVRPRSSEGYVWWAVKLSVPDNSAETDVAMVIVPPSASYPITAARWSR